MNKQLLPSLVLALGFIAGSWIIGNSWYKARGQRQYVSVKGLSERSVRADKATWTLAGSYGASSTGEANEIIEMHSSAVEEFLVDNGFDKSEFKISTVNVTRNAYQQAVDPYSVQVQITLETNKVDQVESGSGKITDLIAKGVTLSGDKWMAGPRYFYTDFQNIKTEMLAEATQNAKQSAEEFARNSGSQVGSIKYANQGVFQLLPASRNNDDAEFYADKIVRVVSSVDYYLK